MLSFTSLHTIIAPTLGNSRPLLTRASLQGLLDSRKGLWSLRYSLFHLLAGLSNPPTILEMKDNKEKNYISGELKLKYLLLYNLCVNTELSFLFHYKSKRFKPTALSLTLHAVFLLNARIKCSIFPSPSLKDTPENKHTAALLCLLILFCLRELNHILSILHTRYFICKPLWDFHLINLDTFCSQWN